jgi:hypothetical protein
MDDGTKYRGRKPTFTWANFRVVQNLLSQGMGISEIAKTTGLRRQTIYRIRKEPHRQVATLASWFPIPDALGDHTSFEEK